MMKVYLLGVYHNFQTEPYAMFSDYVRDLCSRKHIMSIAEEMNRDALRDAKVQQSTVEELAAELSLPHSYCDPDAQQRRQCSILGKRDIEIRQWLDGLSDDDAASQNAVHTEKREKYWLEQMKPMYADPMLFVCGIDHLLSFSKVLADAGFVVEVLEKQWAPDQEVESTGNNETGSLCS